MGNQRMEVVPVGGRRDADRQRPPLWLDMLPPDAWRIILGYLPRWRDVLNLRAVSDRRDGDLIDGIIAEGFWDGNGNGGDEEEGDQDDDDDNGHDLDLQGQDRQAHESADERVPEEFPNGHGSRRTVEEGDLTIPRFPDEILEMFLSHLTRLDDLRTAVNSHKDWRRVLHPSRHLWLFPKVFPFLTKYLGRKEVLNLRHVCSQWRQGVDEHIQNAEHLAPYNSNGRRLLLRDHNPQSSGARFPVWKQTDPRFPYRFDYDSDEKYPQNPLIGREMTLVVKDPSECEYQDRDPFLELEDVPRTFFEAFSHHIYYLNLEFRERTNYWKATLVLQLMYRNLPNLRQLRIDGSHSVASDYEHCETLNTTANLEAFLWKPSPSLRLPRLKTLQLEYNVDGPMELFPLDDILIRKHSATLGRLEVRRWDHRFWQRLEWSQLTELCLTIEIETSGTKEKEVLQSLVLVEAPRLARLSLTLHGEIGNCHRELFQVLQRFPGLQSLGILMERVASTEKERREKDTLFWLRFSDILTDHQAVFPLVKILELKPAPIPLELILNFPNLEALTIPGPVEIAPVRFTVCDFTEDSKPWECGTGIGGLSSYPQTGMVWMNGVDESDPSFFKDGSRDDRGQMFPAFWLQLPRLNRVTVGERIYRRQGFENFAQRFQRLTICDYPSVFSSLFHLNMRNVTEVELQLGFNLDHRRGPMEGRRYHLKLLKILANLPSLEKLELKCVDFVSSAKLLHIPERAPPQNVVLGKEDQRRLAIPTTFPSVTHLKLNCLPISKGFINRFPRLKFLEIDGLTGEHKFCWKWADPVLFETYEPENHPLHPVEELEGIQDSQVWNLLPSLKLFKINGGKDDGNYSRDMNLN